MSEQTPAGEAGTGTDTPNVSKDEIRTIVAGIVNATLKNALPKAVTEALGASLQTTLEKELAPIKAQFAAAAKEPVKPDAEKPKDGAPAAANVPDPAVSVLEAKLAKLEKQYNDATAAAASERRKALQSKAYGDLRQQLTGKVKAEAIDLVADALRARKLVTYDEDGNVSLKVRRSPYAGATEEEVELPLGEALPIFLKTKEASIFLPPPSTGAGAGSRPTATSALRPDGTPKSATEAFEASGYGTLDDNL